MNDFIFNAVKTYYQSGEIKTPTVPYDSDDMGSVMAYLWYKIVTEEALDWNIAISNSRRNYNSPDKVFHNLRMSFGFDPEYCGVDLSSDDASDEYYLTNEWFSIRFGDTHRPDSPKDFFCNVEIRLKRTLDGSYQNNNGCFIRRDIKSVSDLNEIFTEICELFEEYDDGKRYIEVIKDLKMET